MNKRKYKIEIHNIRYLLIKFKSLMKLSKIY